MRLINILFIILGLIFTGIAMIGIIVPVLPTTPFLIISSCCFVRGSERFNVWLKDTKVYKDYAEDFVRDRSMTFKRKVKLMFISDAMLAFPLIKLDSINIRLFIIAVIALKYWYFIFMIKTKKE
ncbi:MAG: YbaN family protein [Tissierellia bacterium]|nr:YbaN family protein [Tissierellia bacterium]